jgi:fructan beta-fructosidase
MKVVLTRNTITSGAKPVPLPTALTSFEMLVDRTCVETFANGGEVSVSRCFLPTESGLSVRAMGGRVMLRTLKLVYLKSAWK